MENGVRLLHTAFERGITLFDTSPDYGDGHSERIVGTAFQDRRADVLLATKVDYGGKSGEQVRASVEQSLERLRSDYIDIIQFHGGNYPESSTKRILEKGLLEALVRFREEGRVRHIGLTVNDPVTARHLIETGAFDTIQLQYNLFEQAAARHALNWAEKADMGVSVMRPLAGGGLEALFEAIAPEWLAARSLSDVCLRFLVSDSRVHTINIGMRSTAELEQNIQAIESFEPSFDIKAVPRSVGQRARAVVT